MVASISPVGTPMCCKPVAISFIFMNMKEIATGLQHIGVPTGDMDATIRFYHALGFDTIYETVKMCIRDRSMIMEAHWICALHLLFPIAFGWKVCTDSPLPTDLEMICAELSSPFNCTSILDSACCFPSVISRCV